MNLTPTPEYKGDIIGVLKRLSKKLSEEHDRLWEEYQQLQREGNYREANDVCNERTGVTKAQRLVLDEWEMILHPERRLPKKKLPMKTIGVRLEQDFIDRLEVVAHGTNSTKTDLVRDSITKSLKQLEKQLKIDD